MAPLIWIDIENPPQVRYLTPFRTAFERRGAEVVITARDYGITYELLRDEHVPFVAVGSQYGRHKLSKVIGLLGRTRQLLGTIRARSRPSVLLSASRAAPLAAVYERIPSFVIADYEYTDTHGARLMKPYLFYPDVIDPGVFLKHGLPEERLIPFRGLKEDLSFSGIDVAAVQPHHFDSVDPSAVKVLVRPPAEQSHYYRHESKIVALHLLRYLAREPHVQVILAPREHRQAAYLDGLEWTIPPQVLRQAVPSVALLKGVDAVVSGGGTMLREAAYLGVPAYGIFQGRIGAVDRYLERLGRLQLVSTRDEVESMTFEKGVRRPILERNPHLIDELTDLILRHLRGG
jgi:predicted glycosyltransferase